MRCSVFLTALMNMISTTARVKFAFISFGQSRHSLPNFVLSTFQTWSCCIMIRFLCTKCFGNLFDAGTSSKATIELKDAAQQFTGIVYIRYLNSTHWKIVAQYVLFHLHFQFSLIRLSECFAVLTSTWYDALTNERSLWSLVVIGTIVSCIPSLPSYDRGSSELLFTSDCFSSSISARVAI